MKGRIKRYEDGGEVKVERSSGIEEILGSLSPVYGMATGKGMFGKNDLGILPAVARRMRRKEMESSDSPVKVSIEVEEDMDMEEPKMMRKGGMSYAQGGSLKMVDKNGSKVPFFAADGKGKMMGGGMTYAKGGMTRDSRDGCAIKGKTKGRVV
jgi:hypothetical protein